jgi:inorganic phosphate transporter, PiT family
MLLIYLSSGLFLGWSLGANHAANVFGTAVATKVIRFSTAALVASIFVILGSVIEGSGGAATLGKLGAVNAMGGAFTVALATGLAVTFMTRLQLPVSTSQSIIGAIIGWNLFTGSPTDFSSLTQILLTWLFSPILAAAFAFIFYRLYLKYLMPARIHLLTSYAWTRIGLIVVGAFGAYSLGANNISNVMGVFVNSIPFPNYNLWGLIYITKAHILFFIGGVAIAVGIFTYSQKVIKTIGNDLFKLSPMAALIVVLAESMVLFLFGSASLKHLLTSWHLPSLPLAPISSSQAVIGGIIGIALARGGKGHVPIRYSLLTRIAGGWAATPVAAGVLCFIMLFVMQNVFELQVARKKSYEFTPQVVERLHGQNVSPVDLELLQDRVFDSPRDFRTFLRVQHIADRKEIDRLFTAAEVTPIRIEGRLFIQIRPNTLSSAQMNTLLLMMGQSFRHKWELTEALAQRSGDWALLPENGNNREHNERIKNGLTMIMELFRAE